MRSRKLMLTALIVAVTAAIFVVGFFLFWDGFSLDKKLDELFNKNLYPSDNSPRSSTAVAVSFDGKEITDEERLLIERYFTYYYAGLGSLNKENITQFYTFQCCDELFDETALRYEIFLAEKSFRSCEINISIDKRHVSKKGKTAEIELTLSAAAENSSSELISEQHYFKIDESEKDLLIAEHSTNRFSRVITESYLDELLSLNGFVRSDLAYTFFPKYTEAVLDKLTEEVTDFYSAFPSPKKSELPPAEYEYDRCIAAETARDGYPSESRFTVYDENDANYISRCIFAGGIPMDAQGEPSEQWKWYDPEINNDRTKSGCVKSWFDRAAFYEYTKNNSGFGLVSAEVSEGSGEIGDIIQIVRGDEPILELMITGTVMDDGKIKDYVVSNDRFSSCTLRSFGCTTFRIIHIIGYNTANL